MKSTQDQVCVDGHFSHYMSHSTEAKSTGLVGDGERNNDPAALIIGLHQNPNTTNTASADFPGGEAGTFKHSITHGVPLSVSWFGYSSGSLLVSFSVCCSGFIVGNGPSADWYLPFVKAADAKVLEHSGKLQLLLEILHWAEELQDKV